MPSETPSALPESTTPPQATLPALEDLIISTDGLGPLRVGQAVPSADPAGDILIYDPEACAWAVADDPSYPASDFGRWVANYDVDLQETYVGPFGAVVSDGVVDIIGIYSEAPHTETGARLHMTREELLLAYPTGLELETLGQGVDNYRLRGTQSDVVFTLWPNESDEWTVNWINIGAAGFEVPMGGTDAFGYWGPCFYA